MTRQDELNQRNEYAKLIAQGLIELLKENEDKLVDKALMSRDGRNRGEYGNTSVPRCRRIAREAVADMVKAVEAAVAKPQKQVLTEKKYSQVNEICRATVGEGNLEYEVTVAGERVATFFADNKTDAAMFVDRLRLGKGVEFARLTKERRMQERVTGACSPESETYWSS